MCGYWNKIILRMNRIFLGIAFILLFFTSCKDEPIKYTINGDISGASNMYIKVIDMTKPGLQPDSLQLDVMGRFSFKKQSNQPGDYIFFFKKADYFRVTPLPNETILIKAQSNKLIETHEIYGSEESVQVSKIIKNHYKSVKVIDTLNQYYLNNQLNPALDSIIVRLAFINDSVYNAERSYLESFIEANSSSLASYIALSLKFELNRNIFIIKRDLKYFEMVDTALYNRFDTIDIVKMMNAYVSLNRSKIKKEEVKKSKSLIGKQAPPISLPNVKGDTLTLVSLRGKYVLVDFWGTWCRPCRKENPNLRMAYGKYKKKGFEIFQVAIEHNKTDWKNTIREDKLYWKYQVSELTYMNSKIAREYYVKAIPTNYLINPEGVVIAKNLFGEALQAKLSELFTVKKSTTLNNAE